MSDAVSMMSKGSFICLRSFFPRSFRQPAIGYQNFLKESSCSRVYVSSLVASVTGLTLRADL